MAGRRWLTLFIIVIQAFVAACHSPPPAPVAERPQPPSEKITVHVVSSGETLYSVAWRYELDFQRLAVVNGLQSPYELYPGQRLSLDMTKIPPRQARQTKSYPVVNRNASGRELPQEAEPPKVSVPPQPPLPNGRWNWRWPAEGKVEKEYDAGKVLKGISIFTDSGTSVSSAAPGVVVYSGNGLRGYGNLLIIKHSDKYLSAYAHNNKLLVSENDAVKQGQKIAEVGVDAASRNRLYFEIRENGKPVDPLALLPKR